MTAFPIYLKTPDGKRFFKILSPEKFEEIQCIGSKCFHHRFQASIHPDYLYISDLIENASGSFQSVDAFEWDDMLNKAASS